MPAPSSCPVRLRKCRLSANAQPKLCAPAEIFGRTTSPSSSKPAQKAPPEQIENDWQRAFSSPQNIPARQTGSGGLLPEKVRQRDQGAPYSSSGRFCAETPAQGCKGIPEHRPRPQRLAVPYPCQQMQHRGNLVTGSKGCQHRQHGDAPDDGRGRQRCGSGFYC